MNAVHRVSNPQPKPPRGCYCDAYADPVNAARKPPHIPPGFCGICERCGQPGHTRHAPAPTPYTGAWCDDCYRRVAIRSNLRTAGLFVVIVALVIVASHLLR